MITAIVQYKLPPHIDLAACAEHFRTIAPGFRDVSGLIAVPAGIALHHYVLPAMAAAANVGLPASFLHVYGGWQVVALALAGLVIAVAGALLPASWAAATKTATALRAE